jgi:serine/threonine-protein phosphatase 6 regulatory ankyrin repeat subunit B
LRKFSRIFSEELIEKGADINEPNEDGFTALMFAARNGHHQTCLHLLCFPGINVNQCNVLGCNAMHYAAQNAHKEVVELLRKTGRVNRKAADLTVGRR